MLLPSRKISFFEDPFFERSDREIVMSTDIIDKENEYEFNIDLPGFDKKDIKVEIDNGQLIVHAKKERSTEDKKDSKVIRQERYYGEFSRSFYVGDGIENDDIKASFDNGVLTISVPKTEDVKDTKKYIDIK